MAYAVLDSYHRHEQASGLLNKLNREFGLGGHLLLAKFFGFSYVRHLKELASTVIKGGTRKFANDDVEMCKAFVSLVNASGGKIDDLLVFLNDRADGERGVTLVQYAQQNKPEISSMDYALLTIAKSDQNSNSFCWEFKSLVDYWFNDYARFKRQYSVIAGYIQILMKLRNMPDEVQVACKDYVLEHVVRRGEPEYLELLHSVFYAQQLNIEIQSTLERLSSDAVNLDFVLRYNESLNKKNGRDYKAKNDTWRNYLGRAPVFLRSKSELLESRELLNQLPLWFLQEVFEHLRTLRNDDPNRDQDMGRLMHLLDFESFVKILLGYSVPAEQDELLNLMISKLDVNQMNEHLLTCQTYRYQYSRRQGLRPVVAKINAALSTLIGKRRVSVDAAPAQALDLSYHNSNMPTSAALAPWSDLSM
ncbi:hypothetical protein PAPHI01_0797 [Pancytospora philotis]|nr:hypothetical protein PAPHI01_0797 [Pancytospora philotis]